MTMKKILIATFALFLSLLVGVTITSAAKADELYSGSCGEGVTWSLDSEGTLTIGGDGAVSSYAATAGEGEMAPYLIYADQIKNVVIGSGVTSIGENAFVGVTAEVRVPVGSSVAQDNYGGSLTWIQVASQQSATKATGLWGFVISHPWITALILLVILVVVIFIIARSQAKRRRVRGRSNPSRRRR